MVFAGIYTAVLGMAYRLQLTFVPQSLVEGNTNGLAFTGRGLTRRVRWSLMALAPLGMVFMVNEALATNIPGPLPQICAFGWVILFSFAAISLAQFFARERKGAR